VIEAAPKDLTSAALDDALVRLRAMAEEMDRRVPNWKRLALLSLVRDGLENLRNLVEDPKATGVSWQRPILELRFPQEWNFKAYEEGRGRGWLVSAKFTAEDVADGPVSDTKVGEALQGHALTVLLHGLTGGIVQWHEDAEYPLGSPTDYLLPKEVQTKLDEVTRTTRDESGVHGTPEAVLRRARLFEDLTKGFPIGGPPLEDLARAADDDARLFHHVGLRRTLEDFPSLSFEIDLLSGGGVTASIVGLLLPLVVNVKARTAFYPVVLGLAFGPRLSATYAEVQKFSPSAWSHLERADFWAAIERELDELAADAGNTSTLAKSTTSTLKPEVRAADSRAEEAIFPFAFQRTIMDKEVAAMLSRLHTVRLPAKRWAGLQTLDELATNEIQRIREDHGEAAFVEKDDRGPLLLKRTRKGETVYALSSEAQKALKVREGLGLGYRDTDAKTGEEFLVRLFQVHRGYLEVGLSWERMAGPWVDEWRKELDKRAKSAEEERRLSLFELDEEQRSKVDRLLGRVKRLSDGWKVLELILSELGASGTNPVRLPAVVLKTLLGLGETDPHARARIESAIESLKAISVRLRGIDGASVEWGGGVFVAWAHYEGAGTGSHGNGDYVIRVTPEAVGCLKVFESGTHRLTSGREVTNYVFSKPTKDQKVDLKGAGFVNFDSGRVFYNAAEEFKPEQENLVAFVERELTLNRDTARNWPKGRKACQRHPNAEDAHEPRVYLSEFCPLLQEGRRYQGALGHFKRNAEAGWTLAGSRTRSTNSGGAHTEGLLGRLGFLTPPGAVSGERTRQYRQALEAMKSVVVEYLDGVVAAKADGEKWLSLADAAALPEDELKRIRWFFFVPETWPTIRRQKWEDRQAERARRGLALYAWKSTDNKGTAEAALMALRGQAHAVTSPALDASAPTSGLELLRHRLRKARLDRGLSLEAVGRVFGVGKAVVQKWELGTERNPEDGKARGKPISPRLVPLIVRWVETSVAPTAAELDKARKS